MPRGGGMPAGNKTAARMEHENAYRLHQERLQKTHSRVDHSPPKKHPHLAYKLKQVQKEEERQATLDHENKLMLEKMTAIMRKRDGVDNDNQNRGANVSHYKLRNERWLNNLERENLKIAKALESVKANYDAKQDAADYKEHRKRVEMYSEYQESPRNKEDENKKLPKVDDKNSRKRDQSENSDSDNDSGVGSDGKHNYHRNCLKSTRPSSVEPLPKIEKDRKENKLDIYHTYEMYWGKYYDPEKHKGREDEEEGEDGSERGRSRSNSRGRSRSRSRGRSGSRGRSKDRKGKESPDRGKKGKDSPRKGKSDGKDDDSVDKDVEDLFKVAKGMAKPEKILISTLIKKNHKERMKIKERYKEKYGKDLDSDLKKELGSKWHTLIDALLTDKEDDGKDNGESGVNLEIHKTLAKKNITRTVEILCNNSDGEIANMKEAYRKEYAKSLESDITDKTDDPVQLFLLTLLKAKRDNTKVDNKAAEKDAKALFESGDGRWTSSSGKFIKLLNDKNMSQVRATLDKFKEQKGKKDESSSGKEALDVIKEECPKDYHKAVTAFANAKGGKNDKGSGSGSPEEKYADVLYNNCDPEDGEFVNTLVERSEVDLPAVKKAYKEKYGVDLNTDIKEKCDGHPTKKCLLELAQKSPSKEKGQKKDSKKGEEQEKKDREEKERKERERKEKEEKDRKDKEEKAKKEKEEKEKKDKDKKDGATVKPAANFNAEDDCEKLYKAMKGLGTDEDTIIDILSHRSNDQRQELKKKYQEKYKKDLVKELKSELSGDLEEVVVGLMMDPKEYEASCLWDSVKGLGTDEASLIGILTTKSGKEMKELKDQYKKSYKKDLDKDIKGDTSGDFQELLLELSKGERKDGDKVDKKEAEEDAKNLYKDKQTKLDPKDDTFKKLMTKKTVPQIKATADEYKKLSGQDFDKLIDNSFKGDTAKTYKAILKSGDTEDFYADSLESAAKGLGTNDNLLMSIIISRSENDLAFIKKNTKRNMADHLGR